VRLSRNKTSARSKGYAFVEFANREVAGIAAEAMDGYMMFKQKLVVSVMPTGEVHPQLFKGARRHFLMPTHFSLILTPLHSAIPFFQP